MELKTKEYWTTQFNFMDEVVGSLDIPERVELYDNTLREGNQTAGCVMRRDEMYAIAKDLDDLGMAFLEFFPAVSEDDEYVATQLVKNNELKNAKVSCLVRPNTKDMDYAIKCGAQHIFLEGPSNMHIGALAHYNSIEEIMQSFVEVAKEAKKNGMTITACPWDNGRGTSMDIMERWVKTLTEAGVDDFCYGDTFNITMPWTVSYMVRKCREWCEDQAIISTHFHNDFGLGTACSLAAVAAGAKRIQGSMNYLGERAGNTALDEVAINLETNMGVKTGIDLKKLYPVSKRIECITKIPVAKKKPILGDEIAWMGSGIVVNWLQQLEAQGESPVMFLPNLPSLVGKPPYEVVYGKGTGTNMVKHLALECGLNLTREQITDVTQAIKEEALLIKGLITKERAIQIIFECCK